MTREAIEYFKFHRKIFCEEHLKICPKDSIAYQATLKEKEFYDMAIKALEQELTLDKIRTEIESCEDKVRSSGDYNKAEYVVYTDAITDVLVIFDKYKAESENT